MIAAATTCADAFGEDAGLRRADAVDVADGVDAREARLERLLVHRHPVVGCAASPDSTTTCGTRCTGTPRNSAYGISVPSLSTATLRAGSSALTSRSFTNVMPRSANAARIACEVSGDGGIGVPNGITTEMSVASRRPRAAR